MSIDSPSAARLVLADRFFSGLLGYATCCSSTSALAASPESGEVFTGSSTFPRASTRSWSSHGYGPNGLESSRTRPRWPSTGSRTYSRRTYTRHSRASRTIAPVREHRLSYCANRRNRPFAAVSSQRPSWAMSKRRSDPSEGSLHDDPHLLLARGHRAGARAAPPHVHEDYIEGNQTRDHTGNDQTGAQYHGGDPGASSANNDTRHDELLSLCTMNSLFRTCLKGDANPSCTPQFVQSWLESAPRVRQRGGPQARPSRFIAGAPPSSHATIPADQPRAQISLGPYLCPLCTGVDRA